MGAASLLTRMLPEHISLLGPTCSVMHFEIQSELQNPIFPIEYSSGCQVPLAFTPERPFRPFRPFRLHDIQLEPHAAHFSKVLLNSSGLRHLIIREGEALDWFPMVADFWPLLAQLHTLDLGEPTHKARMHPFYSAASGLREAVRHKWISCGKRDLVADDIKQLADLPEISPASAFLTDEYVSFSVCNGWNQSQDKGPPEPVPHPMTERYRSYCNEYEEKYWKSGFFERSNLGWQKLSSSCEQY